MVVYIFAAVTAICLAILYAMNRAHAARLIDMPVTSPDEIQAYWNALSNESIRNYSALLILIPIFYLGFMLRFASPRTMSVSAEILVLWLVIQHLVLVESYWQLSRKTRGTTWSRFEFLRYYLGFHIAYAFPMLIPTAAIEVYRQYELWVGGRWREITLLHLPERAFDMVCMVFGAFIILIYTYSYASSCLMRMKKVKKGELLDIVAQLCEKSGIKNPIVLVIPEHGGKLPLVYCLGKSHFVFTQFVLDHLTPDELRAVTAHECGHLMAKHTITRFLLVYVLFVISVGMIAFSSAGVQNPLDNLINRFLFPCLIMYLGYALFRHSLVRQEFVADRIGAELIDDPELMARALVRLHELAVLPTEFPKTMKGQIYHPSLTARVENLKKQTAAVTNPV